jgi:hypothetical protein
MLFHNSKEIPHVTSLALYSIISLYSRYDPA